MDPHNSTCASLTDLEKTYTYTHTQGFSALSSFLSRDPDHETYVFRKFSYLTVRNLVHLQSELADLERQLKCLEAKMANGDLQSEASMRNFEAFQEAAKDDSRVEHALEEMLRKLEAKLEKYHEALLRASSIARTPRPAKRVVKAFRQELAHMGISGSSASLLDEENELVALRSAADKDPLSNFLRDHWPFPSHSLQSSYYPQAQHFNDKYLQVLVTALSAAIGASLLAGSIITLYFVTNPNARLGLLILFIALFAMGIRLSTSATRDSIFAASAAYAAVLVVFVSGNLGNAQPG